MAVFAQPVMVAAAIRAYYTLPREHGDRRKLLAGCAYSFALLCWLAVVIPSNAEIPGPIPNHQSRTVYALQLIHQAARDYNDKYGAYPQELAALGPPAAGKTADCRASGMLDYLPDPQRTGYRIEYHAGNAGKVLGDCPGTKSFTVIARPLIFGKTGLRNYFMDESGVIRATAEDRPATASDRQP